MRSFAAFALPALIAAQSFDFSVIGAEPAAVVMSAPVGGLNDTPAIQPYSAIPSIAVSVINSDPLPQKRAITKGHFVEKRDGNCAAQPNGTGPAVHE